MERHIFELLWPLFGFCQYLGLFPCKRIIDPISGLIQLQPIHWVRQLVFYLLIGIPLGVFGNMTIFIPTLLEGKSGEEVYKCMQRANPATESLLDWLAVMAFTTFISVLFFLSTWGNFETKKGLCELSFFRRSKSADKKIWRSFMAQSVMIFLYPVSNPIMNFELLKACSPSTSVAVRILLILPNYFTVLTLLLPLLIFVAISLEVLIGLIDFCEKLKQKIRNDDSATLLLEFNDLMDYLEQSKKVLSPNYFYITTMLSVEVLLFSFIFLFHVVNKWNDMTTMMLMLLVSNGFYLLMICSLLWFLNIWPERATNKTYELKRHLKNLYVSDELSIKKMEFEGQLVPPSFLKSRIEQELDEFRGFDGKGYFILGKSLLKNLLAFCVTYLVILIQFRLTEEVPLSEDPDHDRINATISK